jgi:4-diphosphocytidyl-2-C-methyl-D-erythritol kinase
MQLRAPAKINLTLEVLERRANGYHGLRSLMVPLDLADKLTVHSSPGFSFSCDDPALSGDDNLVVRAFEAIGAPQRDVHLELRKKIPVQAGLGGGSSDAATVLLAAIDGAFGELHDRDWLAIAARLGSDVPFFLGGTGALVEGTGERVTAAGALPEWYVLVVTPPVGVPTAIAYAMLAEQPRPSRPRSDSITLHALAALQSGNFNEVAACLSNDFQDVVLAREPAIGRAAGALRSAGARHVLLAGSGSSVFALTQTAAERDAIAQRLALDAGDRVFSTRFAATQSGWRAETRR